MELTGLIDRELVGRIKLGVALLAFSLLLADLLLRRAGRPQLLRRLRDGLLAAAGLTAALCWWELGRFQFESDRPSLRWVNFTDSFHYYMGPKYFRELGYTGLYECAAVAELELGSGAKVARRTYRDLSTNEPVAGQTLLRHPQRCKERFEPGRWQQFVHDIDFFRHRVARWEITMQDWGYNATPVWNLAGSLLAGPGPVDDARLGLSTLLDVPCLLAMWGFVAWAFGWRTLCVGLVFWGTNPWSGYNWTGGSILRQEWLVASVIGVCLLRKQKFVAAGATITYAALLSIFPGFLAVGVGLKAIAGAWRERRLVLAPEHRRLLLGALLTLVLVVPAATYRAGGVSAWLGFVANSRLDSGPGPNNMGLPTLLSYDGDTLRMRGLDPEARPFQGWAEARRQKLAERLPLLVGLVGALLALVTTGARRQPDWGVAILGLGFVVFVFQLTNYYYVLLLPFALLWPRHRSVGIALIACVLASHWLRARWVDSEEFFTRSSAVAVLFVAYATAVVCFARGARPEAAAPQTPA
jgi:hypothetical protein